MAKHRQRVGVLVTALVVCAVLARVLAKLDICPVPAGLLRTLLYIGLYMGWGASLSRRVLQPQLRRYFMGIAGLMVFWFVVRSMKYFFVVSVDISRHLWYWYYFPMLTIPLLSVFVSLSLGQPEHYRLPRRAALLYLPTLLLVLLVVTNDLHRLVFTFPAGAVWSSADYGYGLGYYFVMGWEIACALAAFGRMLLQCRVARKKRYLPALLLLASIGYGLVYISGVKWMQLIGGDITAVQCLLFCGILESCIQCGLIPTNSGYDELFRSGVPGAQIADREGRVWYSSAGCCSLSPEAMRAAQTRTVALDQNTLLKSHPIDGGFVYWQEDITDIAALLRQLEENRKALAEKNHLEQENYRVKREILAFREKNRLYDLLQQTTAAQIEQLDALQIRYHEAPDAAERRRLLAKMAVIGAYIKRRGNLLFIGEAAEAIDTTELSLCFEESLANLRLSGASCAAQIPGGIPVLTRDAIAAYDFFEEAAEAAWEGLRCVWLKARVLADDVLLYLEMECDAPLFTPRHACASRSVTDGVWRFTLRIKKVVERT